VWRIEKPQLRLAVTSDPETLYLLCLYHLYEVFYLSLKILIISEMSNCLRCKDYNKDTCHFYVSYKGNGGGKHFEILLEKVGNKFLLDEIVTK